MSSRPSPLVSNFWSSAAPAFRDLLYAFRDLLYAFREFLYFAAFAAASAFEAHPPSPLEAHPPSPLEAHPPSPL
eukprot:CAMPEP_0168384470 /NCGR_PEP_ID=MMETSP0228-20121227/14427_1 /TAXON_ID=133427 /ORGANISM="Protoceratium reticulatum, Strain CCCM 535 (=CCMP 1889)" /LENGTH=73 /DNA_ID=CAMNT_0008397637 /DNA_START=152 /DNA_END=370 /DNA_ORIENTATION=-